MSGAHFAGSVIIFSMASCSRQSMLERLVERDGAWNDFGGSGVSSPAFRRSIGSVPWIYGGQEQRWSSSVSSEQVATAQYLSAAP